MLTLFASLLLPLGESQINFCLLGEPQTHLSFALLTTPYPPKSCNCVDCQCDPCRCNRTEKVPVEVKQPANTRQEVWVIEQPVQWMQSSPCSNGNCNRRSGRFSRWR